MRYNDKKIGFSYFANTNLKAKASDEPTPIGIHPLYVSVSYDRKSTTFRAIFLDGSKPYVSEDLNEIKQGANLLKGQEYRRFVEELIYIHLQKFGEVKWAGLGKRINYLYSKKLSNFIGNVQISVDGISDFWNSELYDCFIIGYRLLKDKCSEMTILDWELKDGKETLRTIFLENIDLFKAKNPFEIFNEMINTLVDK